MAGIAATSPLRGSRQQSLAWLRAKAPALALGGILLLAALLRFTNLNWDESHHLQPDERTIAQVAVNVSWPDSVGAYFDTGTSPLNPANNTFDAVVQGEFPLFIDKLVADATGHDTFDQFDPVSRSVSALCDLLAILLVYLIARRLLEETTALVAALLLALTPLHIQLAHFGTFDTFTAASCLAAFWFALRAQEEGRWWDYALTGVAAGLALGSRLDTLPIVALVWLPVAEQVRTRGWPALASRTRSGGLAPLLGAGIGLLAAVWTIRVTVPYAFAGPSPFDFHLDPRWVDAFHRWRDANAGRINSPEFIQWAGRAPLLYTLKNLVLWGFGLPLGGAALVGLTAAGLRLTLARRWPATWQVALVGWPALLLLYHGVAFLKTPSALAPAYPWLAILAAALLAELWQRGRTARAELARIAAPLPLIAVVALTALHAIAFAGIYQRTNTRIAASAWIYANIPAGSTILTENGDDQLPLPIPGADPGVYAADQLQLFDVDSNDKIGAIVDQLDHSDYLVIASNRVSGAIPRIPEKFPATITYEALLMSGQLGFEQVATFTSYPSIFGITLRDDGADQSLTASDHPRVLIFRKTETFDAEAVQQRLSAVLAAHDVVDLDPTQTGKNLLMFDDAERVVQQTGGTWSKLFHRDDLANKLPVVVWYLTLQLMALVAFPMCWRILGGLPDRGYAVTKSIGLLACCYVAWLLPSLKLIAFGRSAVIIGICTTALLSGLLVFRRRHQFLTDLVALKNDAIAAELIFVAAFALWVWLRSQNPDLWHPYRGGEKPMEFAYFNAIIRSTHFPPYDPWFAGGYINYYYLGYALMAAVTRFTGVVPWVAFNLAVPTLFALLVLNAWSFVRNVLGLLRIQFGQRTAWALPLLSLLGPLFVVGLGNLDLARRIGRGEYGYGDANADDTRLGIRSLGHILRGIWRAFIRHRAVPTDTFWAPSRVISDTVNEFPNFTFLFADFHPHMVGLTFTSATLVVALAVLQSRRWPQPTTTAPVERGRDLFVTRAGLRAALASVPRQITAERALLVAFTGFVTGALFPLNTWDFPTYVLIVVGAFALLELIPLAGEPSVSGSPWRVGYASLRRVALWSLATVALGRIFFAPYFAHSSQPNSGFVAWDGATSRASQYVVIHGIMLFFVVSYLLAELWALARERRVPIATAQRVRVVDLPDDPSAGVLAITFRRATVAVNPAIPLAGLVTVVAMLGLLGNHLLWFLAALGLLVAAVAVGRRREPLHLFLCGMAATALALSAVVERYALRGDIGRFNTVFKFYEQIWMLFSLVAAVGTVVLIARYRHALPRAGRFAWSGLAALLLLAGFVYPVVATPGRLQDRFEQLPPTLNGMAYMTQAVYNDATPDNSEVRPYSLLDDYLAINWLLDNVQGSPVVLEGITGLYRWGSRVSIYTGLPTVLGWDWHQTQQRTGYEDLIRQRSDDVAFMYGEDVDFSQVTPLLDKYHVRYIYVGPLERIYYAAAGLAKFDRAVAAGQLTVAYQQGAVTIYEYNEGARG